MALILNIDTATATASVCLSADGKMAGMETNEHQKDHAAFVQPAIQRLLAAAGVEPSRLDAIAVSNGPGSYTGLRVGLSTAKGIAYATGKPLILLNTLEVMAFAAIRHYSDHGEPGSLPVVFCPMIDARRMEVFTAVYNPLLENIVQPAAMVVDEQSFAPLLEKNRVVFSGSGADKCRTIIHHSNALFSEVKHDAGHMQSLSEDRYLLKSFADTAYSEPFYLKEFFTPQAKLKSD